MSNPQEHTEIVQENREALEPGTSKRKTGKTKGTDPKRPRQALPAYFIWLFYHREQIREDNPGKSVPELCKIAGEMWKVTDKKEWYKKAKQAKKEHNKSMKEYNRNTPSDREGENEEAKTKSKSNSASKKMAQARGGGLKYKSNKYIPSSEDDDTEGDFQEIQEKRGEPNQI